MKMMKKASLGIVTLFMMLSFMPVQVRAGADSNTTPIAANNTAGSKAANILLNRLYEINGMDLSSLNSFEKKKLRSEVQGIKSELKKLDGGVYLSVGAIIIILLILILIL